MKQHLKRWFFRLLGKDPEAVVVSFVTGDAALCARMIEEVRALVPDRRHFVATPENWPELRRELRGYRIGLAPVMLTREANALRRAAYRLAPRKILAYNSRLERHHLRLNLASFLFWRGVPLDRIYSAPLVVAITKARKIGHSRGPSHPRRPRVFDRAPARRRSRAVLSIPAGARRRGAHLPSAARVRPRIRRRAVRVHRRASHRDRARARILRARSSGGKAALS